MSEPVKLIDTSTLSEVMRQRNEEVQKKARSYLKEHERFTFSILTRYEILRGLHAKGATGQLKRFETFCSRSDVLPLEDTIVVKASETYGLLRNRGLLIDDIDILIGDPRAKLFDNGVGLVLDDCTTGQLVAGVLQPRNESVA